MCVCVYIYIYIYIYISSSSSSFADSTNSLDSHSPSVPIIYLSWQIPQTASTVS